MSCRDSESYVKQSVNYQRTLTTSTKAVEHQTNLRARLAVLFRADEMVLSTKTADVDADRQWILFHSDCGPSPFADMNSIILARIFVAVVNSAKRAESSSLKGSKRLYSAFWTSPALLSLPSAAQATPAAAPATMAKKAALVTL